MGVRLEAPAPRHWSTTEVEQRPLTGSKVGSRNRNATRRDSSAAAVGAPPCARRLRLWILRPWKPKLYLEISSSIPS